MLQKLHETVNYIQQHTTIIPETGIILGTGLGGLTQEIEISESISYSNIPNFPVSTVHGHQGMLIFGTLAGKPVVAMKGRFHYYEGYSMEELAFPIRVLKLLGIKLLLISNASGGLNPGFEIGDCMFITDHINLMGTNPLLGKNYDELGPRFPDMKEVYDAELIAKAGRIADLHGITYRLGVYAAVTGPTYETPAEYAYIRTCGADAVGMSTVPEAIIARHMGLKIFALSVITDLGVPGKITEITHEEVIEAASRTEPLMTRIIVEMLK